MRSRFHAFLGPATAALLTGLSVPVSAASTATLLHTYTNATAYEIVNTIPVNMSALLPLLPAWLPGRPASALGLGSSTRGVVVIVNIQAVQPSIDQQPDGNARLIGIVFGIMVAEPREAALANLNLPGAYHFYTPAIYMNDSHGVVNLFASGRLEPASDASPRGLARSQCHAPA
jgi:hypothetical protein